MTREYCCRTRQGRREGRGPLFQITRQVRCYSGERPPTRPRGRILQSACMCPVFFQSVSIPSSIPIRFWSWRVPKRDPKPFKWRVMFMTSLGISLMISSSSVVIHLGGVAAPSGATTAVAAAATRASDSLTINSRRSIYSTSAATPCILLSGGKLCFKLPTGELKALLGLLLRHCGRYL